MDQISEIERIGLCQPLLVRGVDSSNDLRPCIWGFDLARPLDFLLGAIDAPRHGLGLESLLVEPEVAQDAL